MGNGSDASGAVSGSDASVVSWLDCSDAASHSAVQCTSPLLALAPEDWSKKLQAGTAGADSTASTGQR